MNVYRIPRHRLVPVGAAVTLVMAGCGGSKAYVRPGFMEHPPKRVAVLPFVITYPYDLAGDQAIPASHAIGRDVFRKTFYYALTPYGYEDMKLVDVDEQLTAAYGPIDQGAWRELAPQLLGKTLGVDALIYGDINRLMHFSTPLYTETSLNASLRMVDASSGEVLWRKTVKAAERGGALVKKGQVVDFLKDQARSFNPGVKFLRVSDAAVRQALKGLPDPPMEIEASSHSPQGSAVASGEAVRLAVLPLGVKDNDWQKGAVILRSDLIASLQESPFEVLEIQRVDAALKELGWEEGQPLSETLPLSDLAHALGADVLLRGIVTNWGRSYLVVQSWVKAELQLELIDAQSGEVLWSEKKKNRRQAGILKGPTGIKSLATAPITGLKGSNLERVANHLTRSLVEDLSRSPAVMAYLSERN